MAQYARGGDLQVATIAMVIAALSNTLVKYGMSLVLGGQPLGRPLLVATGATLLAGLASLAIWMTAA